MEFTNDFTVPVSIDHAFEVLTDLERVAPCMPGATLDSVEGDTYQGHLKVKVGPMGLTYRGTARLVDVDPDGHTAGIEARGTDQRGGGTANADVQATLEAVDDESTRVVVTTDIEVTGRPAQFGRGVMADVGAKIIDRFSDCLASELSEQDVPAAEEDQDEVATQPDEVADDASPTTATAAAPATPDAAGVEATTPRTPARESAPRHEEALDLVEFAGGAAAKRLAPVAALVAIAIVIWLWRRGDEDE